MLPTLREVNHEMQRYSSRQLMLLIQRSLAIPKQEFEPSEESAVSFPEIHEIKTELLDAVWGRNVRMSLNVQVQRSFSTLQIVNKSLYFI